MSLHAGKKICSNNQNSTEWLPSKNKVPVACCLLGQMLFLDLKKNQLLKIIKDIREIVYSHTVVIF